MYIHYSMSYDTLVCRKNVITIPSQCDYLLYTYREETMLVLDKQMLAYGNTL